jgi:hypothetical protein
VNIITLAYDVAVSSCYITETVDIKFNLCYILALDVYTVQMWRYKSILTIDSRQGEREKRK